ncbi:HAD family phosphatase [Anaerococcus sp. mt242]|uniref:Cof-type HAD-IIB family hydrolase n=1 Tax=Anaerococcus sp. mt242 TaxID=2661917 RepID=UPI0019349093|nr:Cof-type HAD-IIB family hydrolase [Anaerococcus sp. mt242]MBM0046390.1 HAD family phosphatase [Anaerococcus sp. mt242]
MIKLFAIDMDGTLLNTDDKIDPSTKESILRLNASGVKTVLTSGRVMSSIKFATKDLGEDNPMVATNGALIMANNKILKQYPLKDDHLKELVDFCQEHKFIYHFYDEDTFYSNRLDEDRIRHLKIDNDYGLNYQCNISITDDPIKNLKERKKLAYKILIGCLSSHPYGEEEAVEIIKEKFNHILYITSSGPGAIEIMEPHVNKWEGIKELIEFLGIKVDEVAAIGDSYNDLPMIENAKIGFAMGNGNEKVKSISDYVVADNDNGGISEAAEIILEYNKENPSA